MLLETSNRIRWEDEATAPSSVDPLASKLAYPDKRRVVFRCDGRHSVCRLGAQGNFNSDAQELAHFLNDLVHSQTFMNVLNQYGVSGGMFAQSLAVPIEAANNSDDIANGIREKLLGSPRLLPIPPSDPRQSPPIVMCFLDNSTNSSAFGDDAHSHFTAANGEPLIYAVVKFQAIGTGPTAPMDIRKMTQTASHEFAEVVTDPLGSKIPNDPLTGWIDPSKDVDHNEIADLCEGQLGEIARSGGDVVSGSYMERSAGACISVSVPQIRPGPPAFPAAAQGGTSDIQSRSEIQPFERLTPLPPVYINPETNKPVMRRTDLFAYYRKVFHPLRHEMIYPDFPSFLRQLASVIEEGERRSGK